MIKVIYPYNKNPACLKQAFNDEYYNKVIKYINGDVSKLNSLLKRINYKGINLDLQKIITADFVELVEIFRLINSNKKRKNRICKYFEKIVKIKKESIYDGAQGVISQFFMEHNLSLKTCHYCNIDHINVFEERYSYNSVRDMINNAPKEVLLNSGGMSEETAKKIISNRHLDFVFDSLEKILTPRVYKSFKNKIIDGITNINLNEIIIKKNHFTLDHFLPKKDFPYYSLSLYNLVPSCSSCNCKFKGSLEFLPDAKLSFLSPTSEVFALCDDLEFKLFFNVIGNTLSEKIKNVNSLDDFIIEIVDKNKNIGFDTYLNMFKLKGRYEFHRKVALNMISKRKLYSDSQMLEFSNLFIDKGINKDLESIKKDLFGASIFNEDEKNESFAKYSKDIAQQLELIK